MWQGRYGAVVMDEDLLASATRYVSMNPLRAALVGRVQDRIWSSVRAHLAGEDDILVPVAPLLDRYRDFPEFLGETADYSRRWPALRQSETSGRPLGDAERIQAIKVKTGRILAPQKRGPRPKGRLNWCI